MNILQFMAFCVVLAFVLVTKGYVVAAVAVGAVFLLAPAVYFGRWMASSPPAD